MVLMLLLGLLSGLTLNFTGLVHASGITRVQGNARGTWSSGSSVTVTMTNPPANGHVLVLTFASRVSDYNPLCFISSISQSNSTSGGSVTWTRQINNSYSFSGGNQHWACEIWFGVDSGGSGNKTLVIHLTVAPAGILADAIADVCEYSGVATSNFLDQTAKNNGYSVAPDTGTTNTTSQANELWIGCINLISGGQTTPTNSFTLLDGVENTQCSNAYLEKIVSSTGKANCRTSGSSNYWVGCIATFYSAPPTGGISVSVSPVGGGSVVLNNTGPYYYGNVVLLTAVPSVGWSFAHWSGDLTGSANPATLTVTGSMSVTATFTQTAIIVCPASTNVTAGADCNVYINLTNVEDMYTWEFQLNYSPSVLNLTSTSIVAGGLNEPTQVLYNVTNKTSGHLWWAVSTILPTTTGISYSDHAIFEMTFRTIACGTSGLNLYGTILSNSTGSPIAHTVVNGTITVYGFIDLTVTSIRIDNHGCSMYDNDTYANGSSYYYPVEVTISNLGNVTTGSFYVKLEVYWINGSLLEASQEILVSSLAGETSAIINFTSLFHPLHTGDYQLTAIVDSRNNITETNKANNVLVLNNVPVTVMGDINGDGVVNILDAVIIAQAWNSTPGSPNWNIKADLCHNGKINILDATRIGLHWGETS
jgi:hypothetical protein